MDNTARRAMLAEARARSVQWAQKAEEFYMQESEDHPAAMSMSYMWANVAQALKIGSENADRTDDNPPQYSADSGDVGAYRPNYPFQL